jgi:anti-sigma factor RsiW
VSHQAEASAGGAPPIGSRATTGSPPPAGDELDLACRDVVELVSDYLDGALEPPLAAAVERHLALCPPCVEYVRQLRETTRLLGDLPEQTLSEPARIEILAAFRGFRRPEPGP